MNLSRRLFLEKSVSAVAGVSILFSLGCNKGSTSYGDSGKPNAPLAPSECTAGERTVTYANPGHAHTAINLPKQMVTDGVAGFYTLLSGSHDHQFELTADDFAKLQNGDTLTKEENTHGHKISISC